MTKRELAALACKVLALWILAKGVQDIVYVLMILRDMVVDVGDYGIARTLLSIALFSLPGVVPIVFAVIVWKKADSLAGRMVEPDEGQPVSYEISGNGLLAIAIVAIGVALLVFAIPDLVGAAWTWFAWSEASPWPRNPAPLLRAIAKMIVGLWLIVGTRRIVRVLAKVRTIGLDKGPNGPSELQADEKESDE